MRRVIVIAAAGASLAGCSSFSLDSFTPAPPTVQVQLDSIPSGADAKTSAGPGCKTPCSIAVPAASGDFTVTYTLNRFQPVTVPVQVIHFPGHLMFYAPYATQKDVGSGPGAPYIVAPGTPHALMIVVPASGPHGSGDTHEPEVLIPDR